MKIKLTLDEVEIRNILSDHVQEQFSVYIEPAKLDISVRSKQNYRAEWEKADFKLDIEVTK